MSAPSNAQAAVLLSKVREDPSVPTPLRRKATQLESKLDQPAIVVSRLQKIAEEYLPTLPRMAPDFGLVKIVSVDTYWRYYCQPDVRDAFTTSDDLVSYISALADADRFLLESLTANDPLIAWERSWLTTESALRGLSAESALRALEMNGHGPIVVLVMSRSALIDAGVTVRSPCSFDSVLGPHYQWREGGPLSGAPEYIDGPVPRSAVSAAQWRT